MWISIFLLFSSMIMVSFAAEFYSEDEKPFNKSYKYWTGEYWNWWFSVNRDDVFNENILSGSECLANLDGPVVFLMNPSFAGTNKIVKNCVITSQQGVLFAFLTGECDTELPNMSNASFTTLLNCAIEDNQVPIFEKSGTIDGVKIDKGDIKEIKNDGFKLVIKENSVYSDAIPGIWDAAAHGYYVFIKPMSIGDHVIKYKTVTIGTPWQFSADITYNIKVVK